jgi:hypothetical protein
VKAEGARWIGTSPFEGGCPMSVGGQTSGTYPLTCIYSAFSQEKFSNYFRVTTKDRHEEFPAVSKALIMMVL